VARDAEGCGAGCCEEDERVCEEARVRFHCVDRGMAEVEMEMEAEDVQLRLVQGDGKRWYVIVCHVTAVRSEA